MVEEIRTYSTKVFGTKKPIRRATGVILILLVVLVNGYVAMKYTKVIPEDWSLFLGRRIPEAAINLVLFWIGLLVYEWSTPGETIGNITNINEHSEWQRVACATALTIAFIWSIVRLIGV